MQGERGQKEKARGREKEKDGEGGRKTKEMREGKK
jgi:hypothetical protein